MVGKQLNVSDRRRQVRKHIKTLPPVDAVGFNGGLQGAEFRIRTLRLETLALPLSI